MSSPNNLECQPITTISLQDISNHVIKFIHASDIHLGSHQYENTLRSDDYINAFEEILAKAIDHSVNFVLLGGDVFNSLEMLPGKLTNVIEILNNFKKATSGEIPIIAIEGNHDIRRFSRGVRFSHRDQSWLKLCANLGLIVLLDADLQAPTNLIFKPYDFEKCEGGKIQIKNVVIYGTRYLGEAPVSTLSQIRKAIKKEKGKFNILMQHFGIEGQMANVPGIQLELISPLHHRVDYLALGHFHKQFILEDWIYNPGSSESVCSMDFFLKRGIFLVEVKGREAFSKEVQIIKLKNRNYIWRTLKIRYKFRSKESFYAYLVEHLKIYFKSQDIKNDQSRDNFSFLILKLEGINPFKNKNVNQKEIQKVLIEEFPIIGAKVYQKFKSRVNTIVNYF